MSSFGTWKTVVAQLSLDDSISMERRRASSPRRSEKHNISGPTCSKSPTEWTVAAVAAAINPVQDPRNIDLVISASGPFEFFSIRLKDFKLLYSVTFVGLICSHDKIAKVSNAMKYRGHGYVQDTTLCVLVRQVNYAVEGLKCSGFMLR